MKKTILFFTTLLSYYFIYCQCGNPTASTELNINNVRATLLNGGDFWWDGVQNAEYEFPKLSGNNVLFAGAIWLSALDTGGNLKVAAMFCV